MDSLGKQGHHHSGLTGMTPRGLCGWNGIPNARKKTAIFDLAEISHLDYERSPLSAIVDYLVNCYDILHFRFHLYASKIMGSVNNYYGMLWESLKQKEKSGKTRELFGNYGNTVLLWIHRLSICRLLFTL